MKPRRVEQSSLIVVPDTQGSYKPQFYGEVISTGEKVENINPGDIIFFHVGGGQDMMLEDVICRVLKYDEIYGVESRGDGEPRLAKEEFMVFNPQAKQNATIVKPGQ
jgi:co-chaperonin GroES (HSP10)